MTPQSMSEVIHALESKGFIKRDPHPRNRRTLPAALTGEGGRVLAACEQSVAEFEGQLLAGFRVEDRAAFLRMVKAAVRNLGGGFPHV
jgi:DNA-binding MarR family transcriptional regulator